MSVSTRRDVATTGLESDILKFSSLVAQGVKAWTEAGNILIKLLSKNTDAFRLINEMHPEISMDTLYCFERIGRKQIYPPLLADGSLGARRLIGLPFEFQKRYCDEPIDIVTAWENGEIKTVKKRINQLTRSEVKRVIGDDTVYDVEQQAFRLSEKRKKSDPEQIQCAGKMVAVGYFSVMSDKNGVVTIEPCAKSPIAQPVRIIPNNNGWKTGIVLFYRDSPTSTPQVSLK